MTPRGRIRKRSLALHSNNRRREKGKENEASAVQATVEESAVESPWALSGDNLRSSACHGSTQSSSSSLSTTTAPHASPSLAHPSPSLDASSTNLTVTYDYHQSPLPANFPLRSIAELSSVLPSDGPSWKDMCWWRHWHQPPSPPPSCPSRKRLRLAPSSVSPSLEGYQHLLVLASQLQDCLNHASPPETHEQPKSQEGTSPSTTYCAAENPTGLSRGTQATVSHSHLVNPSLVLDPAHSDDDEAFWSQAADMVSGEAWEDPASGDEEADVLRSSNHICGHGGGECTDESTSGAGYNGRESIGLYCSRNCGGGGHWDGVTSERGIGGELCDVEGGCSRQGTCSCVSDGEEANYASDAADAFIDQLLFEGVISTPHTRHRPHTPHHGHLTTM